MWKNKLVLLFLIVFSLISLVSCGDVVEDNKTDGETPIVTPVPTPIPTPEPPKTEPEVNERYTITWVNYNGDILEVDREVEKGTMPSYDGETPSRESTEEYQYIFTGWSPEVSYATENKTYQAIYSELILEADILGTIPVLNDNQKTFLYGLYPQTYVSDASVVAELEKLQPSDFNGWYLYEGNYYCKEVAKVFSNEKYTFDNGDSIVNGNTYWFKCEPISWDILTNDGTSYYLVTTKLLDTHNFYNSYNNRNNNNQTIYANNYELSDLRNWLNNYFYNTAFALNDSFIKNTTVDNSSKTSDSLENIYSCNNTLDKVFLPSYEDYLKTDYGFDSNAGISNSRECKTTDYARARGAWYNNTNSSLKYNGTYWTRTATSEFYYTAWNVNSGGFLSTYAVDGLSHCVRPSIIIYFQEQ